MTRDATYSSEDDDQLVTTSKYMFNLDYNPEHTEEDLPQIEQNFCILVAQRHLAEQKFIVFLSQLTVRVKDS